MLGPYDQRHILGSRGADLRLTRAVYNYDEGNFSCILQIGVSGNECLFGGGGYCFRRPYEGMRQ